MFTHYIAPFGAMLLLGYCMATTGRLTGVSEWVGITYKSVFRAVIEIALGAAAFEVVRKKLWKGDTKNIGSSGAVYIWMYHDLLCWNVSETMGRTGIICDAASGDSGVFRNILWFRIF